MNLHLLSSGTNPTPRGALAQSTVALLIASLALGPATLARANEPRAADARPVVVIDLSADEKEHAELRMDVRAALAAHKNKAGELDFVLADINAALNAGGETRDRQNVATARGFAQAGQAALDRKDYEDAADQLRSARGLYEESLAVADGDLSAIFGDVALRLGEARLFSKDEEGAREALRQAAFFGADANKVSADTRAAYNEVRKTLDKLPNGAVQVNTDPPYAEIFVDGRFQGIAPLKVSYLPIGNHVITVSKPGFERATSRVEITADKVSHRDVKLQTARRKLILDGLLPKLKKEIQASVTPGSPTWGRGGDALVELGSLIRSETVMFITAEGPPEVKTLELWLFHIPTQRLVNTYKAEGIDWSFRNSDAIAKAVAKTVEVNWIERLGGEVKGPEVVSDGGVTSKWWFWTIVGVAVAGGVTAAVLATASEQTPPPFENTPGTGSMVLRF